MLKFKKIFSKLWFYIFIYIWLISINILIKNDLIKSFIWEFCLNLIRSEFNWIITITVICLTTTPAISWIIFFLNIDFIAFFWNENFLQVKNSLTNGFFLIHPVFIFFTYTIGLYIGMRGRVEIQIIIYVFFSIAAVFLGSWWANQELGWGGWWSWDYVEIINLILILTGLVWIHEKLKTIELKINKIQICWYFIFLHLSIRYDFFNSIHSFTSGFSIEYNFMYFILFTILVFCFLEKTKYIIIDVSAFFIKLVLIGYLFKLLFFYNYVVIKNNWVWEFYVFTLLMCVVWGILGLWKKNHIYTSIINMNGYILFKLVVFFSRMRYFFIHFSIITIMIVFLLKKQFEYNFFTYVPKNTVVFYFSDFIISHGRDFELWYCQSILEFKSINNGMFIPLYTYSNFLTNFLTSNYTNFSYYNYYFDILLILLIGILSQLIKNIILKKNKYKIWCM